MAEEIEPLKISRYTISNEFFEKGYPLGGGPCACTSTCCAGGVYVDVLEQQKILQHKEIVKKYMDETQVRDDEKWFDNKVVDDHDFPSGKAMGTEVINDKCAFLDKLGRCSLQVAAVGEGMHKWALKPFFSILFPIEISDNVIGFDPMLQDEEQCCSISKEFETPLFRACKDEFIYLVGENGYQKMEDFYAARFERKEIGTLTKEEA